MSDHNPSFGAFRQRLNKRILEHDNLVIKRFFALDAQCYREGVLDLKTKGMLGLVASLVLRCDDCVHHHLTPCHQLGVSREEMFEIFQVGWVVGGSIVIPHLRRAVDFLDRIEQHNQPATSPD